MTFNPLALAGLFPVGDPGEMRSRAARLQQQGEAVAAQGRRLRVRAASMHYEGPAALRFIGDADSLARDLEAEAARLGELADYLRRAASRVESAQGDWHRRLDRLKREASALEASARRAAGK
ncbi:MAG: hypothetical protein QOF77_1957 [Solirubrobacteraceae bacterium]|jgi:uncharacterized protein YukE|nr:hypothetical protein [Solirubrobacteraceae bacterium]